MDYVVVGDAGNGFTFERLNQALRQILDGADILALEMDRYWKEPEVLVLSMGPFVAALEFGPKDAALVGDDILTDVRRAQKMGMQGILVKTEFRFILFDPL